MENLKYKRQIISLEPNKRILVTSDIHGGYDQFIEILEKSKFCDDDYLFILGDIIERGPDNLKTLRYLINLSKRPNVFILMGNNDTLGFDLRYNLFNSQLYNYLCNRKSLYKEMCDELNIKISKNTNFEKLNKILLDKFSLEFSFLENLPIVIETNKIIFAHAGVEDYDMIDNLGPWKTMKDNFFMEHSKKMPKLLIVGHYPTLAYSYGICDLSPKRSFSKKIISIDGGLFVKKCGQLNCLIIDSENEINIDFVNSDILDKYEIISDQEPTPSPICIAWNRENIEVLQEEDDDYLCCVSNLNELIKIPKEFVYYDNDKWYCIDYTNNFLKLEKGDEVKLVEFFKDKALIKKGSLVGWTYKKNLKLK